MDRHTTIARLTESFGEPTRTTKYTAHWALHPRLDVVAERRSGPDGLVWVTPPQGDGTALPTACRRGPDDRANSNIYTAPSLASGNVLEARVTSPSQLEQVVGYVIGRLDALGARGG